MPVAAEEERAAIDPYLDAIERWVLGHWHIAGPPLVAAAMWTTSALAWATTGWAFTVPILDWPVDLGWWPTVFYGIALVCAVATFGINITHEAEKVPLVGEDKPDERADEPQVFNTKVAVGFGWGFGPAWCAVQAWFGPSTQTATVLACALIPAWFVWYRSRRVQRGVEVFREREKWDGDAIGAPGLEAAEHDAKAALDGSWWQWPLRSAVKGRYTATAIRRLIPRIAARYEVDPGELSIEEPRPGRFVLRYERADPDEKPLEFAGPPEGYSIRNRARVGQWDDDGSPMLVSLYRDGHGGVDQLAVGVKGSGKSTLAEVVACHVAAAKDALLWVIDLKPGAQHWSPWAPVADWLATTPEEADRMFGALMVIMQVRGGSSGRMVKPSTKRPAIVVKLDEGALYYNPAVPSSGPAMAEARRTIAARISLQENLLATSRSFAIAVWVYLQRGIWDNVGGATIRGHLIGGQATIFRTAKAEDVRLAVDLTADEAERVRDRIPRNRPGTCMVQNADSEELRKGRIFNLPEAQRDVLIERYIGTQPALEPAAVDALGEVYANRQRRAPGGPAPAVDEEEPVELPASTVAPRLSEEESLLSVWQACAKFEPKGGTVKQVAAEAGRAEPTVRARLNQLVTIGAARSEGRPKRFLVLGDEQGVRDLLTSDDSD